LAFGVLGLAFEAFLAAGLVFLAEAFFFGEALALAGVFLGDAGAAAGADVAAATCEGVSSATGVRVAFFGEAAFLGLAFLAAVFLAAGFLAAAFLAGDLAFLAAVFFGEAGPFCFLAAGFLAFLGEAGDFLGLFAGLAPVAPAASADRFVPLVALGLGGDLLRGRAGEPLAFGLATARPFRGEALAAPSAALPESPPATAATSFLALAVLAIALDETGLDELRGRVVEEVVAEEPKIKRQGQRGSGTKRKVS